MGPYDWMTEVLDDLQAFATDNEFQHLAEMLTDTKLVAMVSIATRQSQQALATPSDQAHGAGKLEGTELSEM